VYLLYSFTASTSRRKKRDDSPHPIQYNAGHNEMKTPNRVYHILSNFIIKYAGHMYCCIRVSVKYVQTMRLFGLKIIFELGKFYRELSPVSDYLETDLSGP
jgi:hypothetical protein